MNHAVAVHAFWPLSKGRAWAATAAGIPHGWGRTPQWIDDMSDRHIACGIYGYRLAAVGETPPDRLRWRAANRRAFGRVSPTVFGPMIRALLTSRQQGT